MANSPPAPIAYRAKDLLLVPGLLTLARVPLGVAFPLLAANPWWGLGLLLAAGATDVLDGWLARRLHQTTPIGAVVDGITDKIFIVCVIATLLVDGRLALRVVEPPSALLAFLLLAAREVGEVPLLLWFALSRKKHLGRPDNWAANVPGKLATTLQFVAVGAALFRWPFTDALLLAAAGAGALSAAFYWVRTISTVRGAEAP